jgi:leucyl aminopeptidase
MFRSVRLGETTFPDVVVIGKYADHDLAVHEDPAAQMAARRTEFRAKLGEIAEAFPNSGPRLILVGLGEKEALNAEGFRKATAMAMRRVSTIRANQVEVRIGGLADEALMGRCFGEAAGLLCWPPADYRGSATDPDERVDVTLYAGDEEFRRGLEYGLGLAESANFARRLAYTPPNIATPFWMAEQTKSLGDYGLSVAMLDGEGLEIERMVGLINVGKASENPPCLIRIAYVPDGGSHDKPVVLIGKTITYDTGGLSIKTKTGMPGMKFDKSGGCAVIGAMHFVATVLKPNFPVVALCPAAENSISNVAYRPDDVLEYRNGVTVEVTNTDAEGRLVLADALCWAVEKENPSCIVDIATLTGGVVTALGGVFAGTFSNDDALWADLMEASAVSGEKLWRLPLHPEYKDMLKSPIADIVNSNPNGRAHPVQGATFLQYFVPDEIPWAHIDIAGASGSYEDKGMFVPGPNGFGVRLFADFLRDRV